MGRAGIPNLGRGCGSGGSAAAGASCNICNKRQGYVNGQLAHQNGDYMVTFFLQIRR